MNGIERIREWYNFLGVCLCIGNAFYQIEKWKTKISCARCSTSAVGDWMSRTRRLHHTHNVHPWKLNNSFVRFRSYKYFVLLLLLPTAAKSDISHLIGLSKMCIWKMLKISTIHFIPFIRNGSAQKLFAVKLFSLLPFAYTYDSTRQEKERVDTSSSSSVSRTTWEKKTQKTQTLHSKQFCMHIYKYKKWTINK